MRFSEPGARFTSGEQIALIVTLLLGTAGLPHIVNRFFTSTSGRAARTSTVWVLTLAGGFYFLAVLLGVAARWELPKLIDRGTTNGNFIDGIVRVPEQALLLLADELGSSALLALVALAALAAIFSTVAGLLIAAATSWGHDVYEQFVNPFASERRRVVLGQTAVIGTASVAAAMGLIVHALQLRPSVAVMVTWAFAIAGSALTPVFVLAVWWKRMTAEGAVAGMIAGASVSLWAIGTDLVERATAGLSVGSVGSFPTIVAAPTAILAAVVVSLTWRPAPDPAAAWLKMHGTADERRQATLARLAREGGDA